MSDPYFLLQCHLFLPGGGVGVVGVVGGVGGVGGVVGVVGVGGVGVPQWLCARPEVGFLARSLGGWGRNIATA